MYVARLLRLPLFSEIGRKMRLVKAFGTACMVLVLVSSGAAWALQHCLLDSEAVNHVHIAHSESANPGRNGMYSTLAAAIERRHQPVSRIHCPENHILKFSFGPASSVFRLEPPKKANMKAIPPTALVNASTSATNAALLDWSVWLSTTPRISPHLFFSKLRI
jgi:hypothetical protein